MANDVKIVLTAQDKASKDIDRVTGRVEALEKASSLVASRMAAVGGAIAGVASIATGLALPQNFGDFQKCQVNLFPAPSSPPRF